MKVIMTKVLTALMITALLLGAMPLIGVGSAQGEDGNWHVEIEEDTTDALGGGKYRMFRFARNDTGVDARFGVLWGTNENPNSIALLTTQSRYLGKASVYNETGDMVKENDTIKTQSLLATKIYRIFEYNDTNGNGICGFVFDQEGNIDGFEEMYKYVDLTNATWEATDLEETEEGQNTSWTFTLSAQDLSYYDPGALPEKVRYSGMENEQLEYVNFTFHLTAGVKEVDNVTLPHFRVDIKAITMPIGNREITVVENAEKDGTYDVSGVVGTYDMKWDHNITGWDFQPENQNKKLVMGFRNIYGSKLGKHREEWMGLGFLRQIGEDVKAHFRDEDGNHRSNMTGPQNRPRKLIQNRIDYGGEWSRVGRFNWVSNVTVDGEAKEMKTQLMNGFRMSFHGLRRQAGKYFGFYIHGGLNYPGGNNIYHDPGLSGNTYLDIGETAISTPNEGRGLRGLFFMGMIAGTALVIVVGLLYTQAGKEKDNKRHYDRERPKQEEDWSDYYDRGD